MKMPLQKRLPVLHKLKLASDNIIRISIFIAKMKKPPMSIPKLIFLRKSRSKLVVGKRFKLRNLQQYYNYGFLGEYQFDSPSTTPLVQYYYQRNHQLESRRSIRMLLSWKCFGCLKGTQTSGEEEEDGILALEALPAAAIPVFESVSSEAEQLDSAEDSVDERAEKFIRRFYAEMRLQRQESF